MGVYLARQGGGSLLSVLYLESPQAKLLAMLHCFRHTEPCHVPVMGGRGPPQCRGNKGPCVAAATWQHLRGIDVGCGSWGAAPGEGRGRGGARAVIPGPSTLTEAHELPGLNAGSAAQGCWEPALRGLQPQAVMQSPAGKEMTTALFGGLKLVTFLKVIVFIC